MSTKRKGWKAKKKARIAANKNSELPVHKRRIARTHSKKLRTMAKIVRKSASQKCIRLEMLAEPDVCCAHCGSEEHLEIHHVEHLNHLIRRLNITNDQRLENNYDEVYDVENMVVLCHNCHVAHHAQPNVNR